MRIALAAAAVSLLAFSGAAGAQNQQLFGTVGPGFTIRLTDATGIVSNLAPGTYTVQVKDMADIHDFHLTGPGVDMATDIEGTGTVTWTVTLTDGTYHYQCDAHPTQLHGNFTVGPPPPPPPPPPPAPKPAPVHLNATVVTGAISVKKPGARLRVASVKAGPVVVVVADRSARDDFHLSGPGLNRATSKVGKGTFTWRLTLRRGLYTYRSDATPRLKGSFRAM